MVFRFHATGLGADEILIDSHTGGAAIVVTGGLFDVQLGSGAVSDGSGPGTYASLAGVFADYPQVWLSVQVGTEVLAPRTRIVAAGYALNAGSLEGRTAAQFLDTTSTAQTKSGELTVDTTAAGGGRSVLGPPGYGAEFAGYGGILAHGENFGGSFADSNDPGTASVGIGAYGIVSYGSYASGGAGGYFKDLTYSGQSYLGHGDTGIDSYGTYAGGIFRNGIPSSYTDEAYLAFNDVGVQGYGDIAGGVFSDRNQSGVARVGYGDSGIEASGSVIGGYFELPHGLFNPPAASAYVAYSEGANKYGLDAFGQTLGIRARSSSQAGLFEGTVWSGKAWLAYGDYGVRGFGAWTGGHFYDTDSSSWAYVGYDVYKIIGSGFVSFMQNHPTEKDKVIVYAAPEGDEVAVYTRGTARLVDGEAHVALGRTFAWVTNPDIGLTAHLTPRGEAVPLAVASVTPTELVVRGPAKGAITFDYIVYGLRIGFEEASIVQPKLQEAYIPSMAAQRATYTAHPELRQFNALERYKAAREEQTASALDLSHSQALRAAIQEYDPAIHGRVEDLQYEGPAGPLGSAADLGQQPAAARSAPGAEADPSAVSAPDRARHASGRGEAERGTRLQPGAPAVDIREPVEPGDVLANDARMPGILGRANSAADPGVIGIVGGDPGTTWTTRAPLALAGTIVTCKVDAGYGAIQPNDLLVASPTPGHAMRAADTAPGTIVGKALEPLDAGTGVIRVLVMSR